jgi:hypothetical protein
MFSNSSENCPGKKIHQCLAKDCIIPEAEHPLLCDPMADPSIQKKPSLQRNFESVVIGSFTFDFG